MHTREKPPAFHINLGRAWLWLILLLLVAVAASYLVISLIINFQLLDPAAVFSLATSGLRNVGRPMLLLGDRLGFDKTVMMFLSNLMVALLIVSTFYWVALLNPAHLNRKFASLRRQLQRDRSVILLQTIPPFRRIWSPHLRLAAFLLVTAPLAATFTLGLLTGALIVSAQHGFDSHLLAVAYILPHGCIELAAFLLACSIPLGTWLTVRDDLVRGRLMAVFEEIEHLAGSSELQLSLKSIISLLWVAGVVESYFTMRFVAILGIS